MSAIFVLGALSVWLFGYCNIPKFLNTILFSDIISQFSHSVMFDSLRPHEPQYARPPCPSPTAKVHTNPCPLSWWCHQTISSCQSPSPALNLSQIRVFSNESVLCIKWPKYWSFSFNISPSNEHPRLISLRMEWLDFLAVQGTLRVFSNTTGQKHQFFSAQLSLQSNSHIQTWPLEKP